ncbi:MAG: serine hydrolase [Acidobacteriota bacterium]|nr:serine hydrolase [Acidobacteriota bacterium]
MTGGFRGLGGIALVPGLLAGCAAPDAPQPATIGPASGYEELAGRLAGFVQAEIEHKRIPALALAITDGDQVVWARGFGEARPGVPADADTLFRVGSVSKLFTDIAVVARHQAGELDLDGEVSEALPGFQPANVPEEGGVTLRRLMAHRAGLVREPPVGHYFDDTDPSLAATVESLNGVPLVFPPGTRQKYSNAGIAVVGRVLERAAGMPFGQAVTGEVLAPLGLESSFFSLAAAPAERVAHATMWSYDGREFPAPGFPLGMAPAGSMVTSVRDLGRFLTLLAGGELPGVLDSDALAEMWRVQFPADRGDPEPSGFGLGFFVGALEVPDAAGETASHRIVRHGGAIYGYSTELAFLPEAGLGVVAVSNVDFTNAVVSRIAELALRGALGLRSGSDVSFPRSEPLPEGLPARLHGVYETEDGASLRVLARGGRAELEIGSATVELRASGTPGVLIADSRLSFGPEIAVHGGDAGEIRSLGIGDREFRRVPEPRPPPPPAEFLPLIGEYGWDHNILFVFERDGALTVLIEWLERYPLAADPDDPDRFHFPDRGLYPGESLRFLRGTDGRVTGADLSGIVFERRPGPGEGTFRIEPLLPVEELRRLADAGSPPVEEGDFLDSDLVRLTDLDPTIRLDVRYAGENNFMGTAFYQVADAFLQRPAAEALARAHATLGDHGYGVIVQDGYRPWRVTKMFFDATPEHQRIFVADPASGSRHNRGAAVDIGLYDRATGEVQVFVSGYDEFSERAFPRYVGGTSEQRWLRELLRQVMEHQGFDVYEHEWWHFDYRAWERYGIQNVPLHRIGEGEPGP